MVERIQRLKSQQKAFTLLEVLVALLIFSLIGLASYQVLQTTVKSRDISASRGERLAQIQKALLLMERDFAQIVNRPARDSYGDHQKPLVSNNDDYLVELTRAGWSNLHGVKRSELQRVGYKFEDEKITRFFWNVLDRAQDSPVHEQVLLQRVSDFSIEYIDAKTGSPASEWPPIGGTIALPLAVRLKLELEDFGVIEKLFILAELSKNDVASGISSSPSGNPPGGSGAPGRGKNGSEDDE